uniref:Uncharacterized protein n=1 Tax=Rhizophora mucronata TaxID=61149 RepID=A0A2P2MZ40_RHIMU
MTKEKPTCFVFFFLMYKPGECLILCCIFINVQQSESNEINDPVEKI